MTWHTGEFAEENRSVEAADPEPCAAPASSYFPDWLEEARASAGPDDRGIAQEPLRPEDDGTAAAEAGHPAGSHISGSGRVSSGAHGPGMRTGVADPAERIVHSMREAQRIESASRGRVLREAANLYAHALRRRQARAWELMERTAPWMIEDPAGQEPSEITVQRMGLTVFEVRGRESAVAGTLTEGSAEYILRDIAAEIAVALMLPAGTARALLQDALVLAGELPQVLSCLEAGTITWGHARTILHQWRASVECLPTGRGTDAEVAGEGSPVEPGPGADEPLAAIASAQRLTEEMMARAPQSTVAQLNDFGRRRRAALDLGAQARSCAAARKRRDVWVEHAEDGLSYLHALVDSGRAAAIRDRIDRMAKTAPADSRSIQDKRSLGEKRADVLCDLLLDAEPTERSGFQRGIRGQVTVTVPAGTLARHDPELAELAGYGPIGTQQALEIAAGASSWRRILTDPGTGQVLQYGRDTYAVPAGLRKFLQVRDETCRFPGCRRSALTSDVDHTVAWENGGTTDAANTAHLCRHHHRIKHEAHWLGQWSVRQVPPDELGIDPTEICSAGVLEWRSPTGVVRRTVAGGARAATTTWLDPAPF